MFAYVVTQVLESVCHFVEVFHHRVGCGICMLWGALVTEDKGLGVVLMQSIGNNVLNHLPEDFGVESELATHLS